MHRLDWEVWASARDSTKFLFGNLHDCHVALVYRGMDVAVHTVCHDFFCMEYIISNFLQDFDVCVATKFNKCLNSWNKTLSLTCHS